MSQIARSTRKITKQGNLIQATVLDIHGTQATIQLSGNGAIYHNLLVIGGPVFVGDTVHLDFTTGVPHIVAPSWSLNSQAAKRYLFGLFGRAGDNEYDPIQPPGRSGWNGTPPNPNPPPVPPPDPSGPKSAKTYLHAFTGQPSQTPEWPQLFPTNNHWNFEIGTLGSGYLDSRGPGWITSVIDTGINGSGDGNLRFNGLFGAGTWNNQRLGFPINLVSSSCATMTIDWWKYGLPSDEFPGIAGTQHVIDYPMPGDSPGPYPSGNPLWEDLIDHHILIVQSGPDSTHPEIGGKLFEFYMSENYWPPNGYANFHGDGTMGCGSSAWWPIDSNELRTDGWTSCDAAGFPMAPGLVRFDEVASGEIRHSLRFNLPGPGNWYIWPARHTQALYRSTCPYGAWFRLKSGYDISGFDPHIQIILTAMKHYGVKVADMTGGYNWVSLSGEPDDRWEDQWGLSGTALDQGHYIGSTFYKGLNHLIFDNNNFETINNSLLQVSANSGACAL